MAGRGDIKAGRAFVELYTKNAAFLKGLQAAKARLEKFGKEITAIGATLMRVSGAALIPFALSVKRFSEFDDKMREVKAVTQASGDEFGKLTEKAKALGASTSFTAVEVAALMAELGRAGFNPAQVEKMTGAVLDLARATSTEAVIASGIMAATMRQFGLEAGNAARVADILTTAANKSFNTVETLGEAMSYAGPVAMDFNVSLEETAAILGTLGNVGIQGSNAGTALRRLLTLTGAEADRLKDIFGVSFVDAAGNARPLVDTLDEVNEATKNLGTAARSQKFNDAFGLLGITGASAISKTVTSTKELAKALYEAGGASSKAAKEMDAGIGGSFRILLSAIEGIGIAIGDALNGPVKDLAEQLTGISGFVTDFVKNNKELVSTLVKVAAGVFVVGGAFVAIGSALSFAAFVIGGFVTAWTAITTIASVVVGAFSSILLPIGLIAAALAAGVTAWALYTESGRAAVAFLMGQFTAALDFVKFVMGGIGDALAGGNLQLAAQIGMAGVMVVFQKFKLHVMKLWGEVQIAFTQGIAFVGQAISSLAEQLGISWQQTFEMITLGWTTFRDTAVGAFAAIGVEVNALISRLSAAYSMMIAVAKVAPQVVGGAAAGANAGVKAFSGVDVNKVLADANAAAGEAGDKGRLALGDKVSEQEETIRRAEEELARLVEEAARLRRKKPGEEGSEPLPVKPPGGGFDDAAKQAAATFGSFSGAALSAASQGGWQAQMLAEQKKVKEEAKRVADGIEKIDKNLTMSLAMSGGLA